MNHLVLYKTYNEAFLDDSPRITRYNETPLDNPLCRTRYKPTMKRLFKYSPFIIH